MSDYKVLARFRGNLEAVANIIFWVSLEDDSTQLGFYLSTGKVGKEKAYDFAQTCEIYEAVVMIQKHVSDHRFGRSMTASGYLLELVIMRKDDQIVVDPENGMQMLALAAIE